VNPHRFHFAWPDETSLLCQIKDFLLFVHEIRLVSNPW